MKALEEGVRAIQMDGLLWGASKLAPLAYGIHKLQITCVVEDDKVSVDLLTENIEELTDLVSTNIWRVKICCKILLLSCFRLTEMSAKVLTFHIFLCRVNSKISKL